MKGKHFYIKKQYLRKGDNPNESWTAVSDEKNGMISIQIWKLKGTETRRISINHIQAVDLYWNKSTKKMNEEFEFMREIMLCGK